MNNKELSIYINNKIVEFVCLLFVFISFIKDLWAKTLNWIQEAVYDTSNILLRIPIKIKIKQLSQKIHIYSFLFEGRCPEELKSNTNSLKFIEW